jgi:hypothetical protein
MREIRTSGSMRGGRKRAFARRACLLLYSAPIMTMTSSFWTGTGTGWPASDSRAPGADAGDCRSGSNFPAPEIAHMIHGQDDEATEAWEKFQN